MLKNPAIETKYKKGAKFTGLGRNRAGHTITNVISEYGTFKKNHNPKSLFHLSYLYDEDPASYTGKDK